MTQIDATVIQREVCKMYGAEFLAAPEDLKVGIALNVRSGVMPINGVRHVPEGDTTGWYIWAGETLSEHDDFFQPLHVKHLPTWCPETISYLGLSPGWRFLITGDYVDVWFDPEAIDPK